MSEVTLTPAFEIGEHVHHVCTNANLGVVVDWGYFALDKRFEYYVTFSNTKKRKIIIMSEVTLTPAFEIGEHVYHVCTNSDLGVIVDWRYFAFDKRFEYYATFSNTDHPLWFSSAELVKIDK